MSSWILLPVFLPAVAGLCLLAGALREYIRSGKATAAADKVEDVEGRVAVEKGKQLRGLHMFTAIVLIITAALALAAVWSGEHSVTFFYLMKDIPIYFHIDGVGRLFVTFMTIIWVLVGIYSFTYMKHEGNEKRFFGLYLLAYGVLIGLDFSGNLVTMYLFYELLTLVSMPMVMHSGTHESIMAALKYLFYSMCGAYMGLFGIFYLYRYCGTLSFVAGGSLDLGILAGHEGFLLAVVFVMLVGFGAKAGMFPLHAWLPTAHPVAPCPASAVLSGVIVKAGVLMTLRVVYYVVGADFLRGTWVQTAWMSLTLITVFMGSMLAYREKVFKKRLAYSTVSQVSYILFGLSLMQSEAVTGALMHVVFHGFIKCALFLTAGVFIFQYGKTRVDEFLGLGKKMPVTMWSYTLASLALIGIPPASGFISKWHLAEGALNADVGVFRYLGPAVLLVSALLTAGYLLPVTMNGFFPGKGKQENGGQSAPATEQGNEGQTVPVTIQERQEPPLGMRIPLVILAALGVLLGIFPNLLEQLISGIVSILM